MYLLNYLKRKLLDTAFMRNYTRILRKYNDISAEETPDVTVNIMRRTLQSQKVKYEEGHACLLAECMLCAWQSAPAKCPKVYINKTTGFFCCHCGKQAGAWKSLDKLMNSRGKEKICREVINATKVPTQNLTTRQVLAGSKPLVKCSKEKIEEIMNKLDVPNWCYDGFLAMEPRTDELNERLLVPLIDLEGKPRILVSPGEHMPAGVGIWRISRAGGQQAVLVPRFQDAAALLAARTPGYVVWLPQATSALPPILLPHFERFSKLILWLGSDPTSWNASRMFARKLGEKRCHFMRPTEGAEFPADFSSDKEVREVLTTAKPAWHRAITTFSELREDVLCELRDAERVAGIKWRRFPTLSRILRGHRRGELTVITGPTGSGKTTFVSEYSLDLAMQGVTTLWGSFEIRNSRLARIMLQQFSGEDLEKQQELFDPWADKFEELPIFFMTFHGAQPLRLVMEAVEHAAYVHDIAHVVVDNVQFMLGVEESHHSDRFWKQDAVVAAFRTFATRRDCHVTLVMHPRKEREDELNASSIFGGAKASQEADNVLIIQDKRLTQLRGRKYLQVVKNRYSGDLGVMPLEFDKAALSYAQKKKKKQDEAQGTSQETIKTQDVPAA